MLIDENYIKPVVFRVCFQHALIYLFNTFGLAFPVDPLNNRIY
jgi:hypothetical protein